MSPSCEPGPIDADVQTTWDAIVIGAGPAGALAARQMALAGRRVLLVEKKRFPRWKVCGACLNGHSLAALRTAGLGSLVTDCGGIKLDRFQVAFRGRTAHIAMPEGMALSRSRLDAALVQAATAAGARFLQETHAVVGETESGSRLVRLTQAARSIEVAARVVLVAAGLGHVPGDDSSSPTTHIRPGSRIGAGCLIADAPGFYVERAIFMAVGREGYVGAVRVEDGGLNVAAAFEPAFVRRHGTAGRAAAAIVAEAGFPSIAGLEDARWQGTAGLTRQTRPVAQERLFILGDAAGYVEPFTGEGIAWALVSAQAVAPLAVRAMEEWNPRIAREWSDRHRRLVGRRQRVCRAVALGLRQPWLAALGFEALSRVPRSASLVLRRLNAPASFTNAS